MPSKKKINSHQTRNNFNAKFFKYNKHTNYWISRDKNLFSLKLYWSWSHTLFLNIIKEMKSQALSLRSIIVKFDVIIQFITWSHCHSRFLLRYEISLPVTRDVTKYSIRGKGFIYINLFRSISWLEEVIGWNYTGNSLKDDETRSFDVTSSWSMI
jgi:hypothetical protein